GPARRGQCKRDLERRAASWRATEGDDRPMVLNDLVREGQAESGAPALRREERIEDLVGVRCGDAEAGVFDLQRDATPPVRQTRRRVSASLVTPSRAECQPPSGRHRLECVADQIYKSLIQLLEVALDRRKIPSELADDRDLTGLDLIAVQLHHPLEEQREAYGFEAELSRTRQLEQFVHDPIDPFELAGDDLLESVPESRILELPLDQSGKGPH